MRSLYIYCTVILMGLFFTACNQEGRLDHLDGAAPAPAQVSDIKSQPTAGGAILTYTIPEDPHFSYVKAVYEIQPGVYRQAKASNYIDTLRLVGFGDTLRHPVTVYSVGKNEKESEPLTVTVKPLIPPVYSVYDSLDLVATFGGVQVGFENPSQAKLAIKVMMDSTGNQGWKELETFYTGALNGSFSVRGLDSTRKKFGIYIRDRWNNKSDTLVKYISPLFEQEIPKNTWNVLVLDNDQTELASSGLKLTNLWDGLMGWPDAPGSPYASSNGSTLPQWFTIDLGVKVAISRIVEHQTQHPAHLYDGSGVKVFEIWGSNNPTRDGSWESWDSLATFHSFKPSGLPLGEVAPEDKQYGWYNGEDFDFDRILPAYRYIRWKTLETYNSNGQVVIAELDIYGRIEP